MFVACASLEVLELGEERKYMVFEKKDLCQGSGKVVTMLQRDIPHDSIQTSTYDDIDDDQPGEDRETPNVTLVHEQICICGKWQHNKYPCCHAIAYLHKWKNLTFPDILNNHVDQYYKMIHMKGIYKYNMNFVIQDSIRFDGETKPPEI